MTLDYTNGEHKRHCFHCGTLIYDISVLYGEKFNGELYCTQCNRSIRAITLEVGNA